jgi:DNA-binding NarL/FixJ family response regulator
MACRILLAHSHEIVRLGLRVMLETNSNVSICGEAADGLDAIHQAHQLRPDIVIADYNTPKANGFIVSRRILRRRAEQKIVIMDVVESAVVVRRLIRAGVRAVISMSDPASAFVNAIDALQRHRPYFPRFVERLLLESYLSTGGVASPDPCDKCLSLRQQEVVQLLAEGRSTKEVAAVLGLSTKTAETHRSAILHKLQLHNIAQLTRYAVSQHIVTVARLPEPLPVRASQGPEQLLDRSTKVLTIAA